jgi:hypothetical protein
MADVITVVNIVPNLSSGESNGDSEANLAVNSANVQEMVATAFTPSPNLGSQKSPGRCHANVSAHPVVG